MKKTFGLHCLVLLALILTCRELKSQDLLTGAGGERIQVCTDRTMYVSGEKVFFSAIVFNVHDTIAEEFSRAFYCELITPRGTRIAGMKYLLENSSGQGCLTIPEETISGVYFLKFYTRFMRNISTDEYKYIMLKIINPYKTEVLPGVDDPDTTPPSGNNARVFSGDSSVKILSGKKSFSPREEIRVNIRRNNLKGMPARLVISVIPESTYEDPSFPHRNKADTVKNVAYYPETRGISLSGQVIGKESGKPVQAAKVNLSIIGDKDVLVVHTDSSGRFFFVLPDYHGNKDIFLCTDDMPDFKPEILIDNDFCSRPVDLPVPIFKLSEAETKAAYKLAVNSRITTLYTEDSVATKVPAEENRVSFYGKPSEILVMDKYIDLPSLGEYFTELPGAVKLRTFHGRKLFRFYTDQDEMFVYDPLLLVDWVAVNDIQKILGMSPREIARIELVNSLYVKGDNIYGGVISFVSKKNDFAGIDLPTSGTFVNYKFLEDCQENILPGPSPAHIPDSRNTLYWNPAIQTDEDGNAGISFQAPDTPGKYYIILRGMNSTGEVVLTEETIIVGND